MYYLGYMHRCFRFRAYRGLRLGLFRVWLRVEALNFLHREPRIEVVALSTDMRRNPAVMPP